MSGLLLLCFIEIYVPNASSIDYDQTPHYRILRRLTWSTLPANVSFYGTLGINELMFCRESGFMPYSVRTLVPETFTRALLTGQMADILNSTSFRTYLISSWPCAIEKKEANS